MQRRLADPRPVWLISSATDSGRRQHLDAVERGASMRAVMQLLTKRGLAGVWASGEHAVTVRAPPCGACWPHADHLPACNAAAMQQHPRSTHHHTPCTTCTGVPFAAAGASGSGNVVVRRADGSTTRLVIAESDSVAQLEARIAVTEVCMCACQAVRNVCIHCCWWLKIWH